MTSLGIMLCQPYARGSVEAAALLSVRLLVTQMGRSPSDRGARKSLLRLLVMIRTQVMRSSIFPTPDITASMSRRPRSTYFQAIPRGGR